MKITVRVHGLLDAEMELPEAQSVSALGITNWSTWHENQYAQAMQFVEKCAEQAATLLKASDIESRDE